MAFKTRQEIGFAVFMGAFNRIIMHGGATGETFFNDLETVAKLGYNNAGPPHRRCKPGHIILVAHGLCAVRVGIAIAEDAFHDHRLRLRGNKRIRD